MHVLHILNSTSGGSAASTLELIEALRGHGVTSYLLCDNNGTAELRAQIAEQVEGRVLFLPLYWMNKKIRAKAWKRPLLEVYHSYRTGRGYRYQRRIQQYVREEGIALLHTSTILNPEGAIAAKALGLPHVWHVRELVGPGMDYQFDNYGRWARWVTNHADMLVANSAATLACLRPYYANELLVRIPNAIRVSDFGVEPVRGGSPLVIGMVGNVTSRLKNHSLFVEMAAVLREESELVFCIYGRLPEETDPYLRALRQRIADYGLEERMMLRGFGAPPTIMQELDILVHPNGQESFGRIFVEAMAAGKPVIGINEGGATEMIAEGVNGYLCAPDAAVLAQRVRTLVAQPELRREMGRQGRQQAEAEYDLPILAERVYKLYKEVLL